MWKFRNIFILMLLLGGYQSVGAQSCELELDIAAIQSLCEDTAIGEACLVAEDGAKVALSDLESLETADSEIIVFQIPNTEGPIRAALFGQASLENRVELALDELPTLPVRNGVGYDVNMREGAGANFPLVGSFGFNLQTLADGRNADGTWIRVQTKDGAAWVSRDLVRLEGDPMSLAVLDSPYTAPYQAMQIRTENPATGCATSGLLIHYEGENAVQLQINGADLTLQAGLMVVQADEESTTLHILADEVSLRANGENLKAQAGQSVQLAADSAPQILPAYAFEAVAALPVAVVAEEGLACIAGAESDSIASYQQPAADASPAQPLDPIAHYAVTGYAADESGALWWQVQNAAWVPQDAVRTAGLCANVVQIDPAAQTFSPAPSSGGGVNLSAILAGRSIWQANSGHENQSGTCNYPPVALCEHLVAITPNPDGTIAWRGQEVEAYTLYPDGGNFFGYSGRNKLNNSNLTLGLVFTGEASWRMTMTQVFDNDPECIRTFNYSATRNW